MEELQNEVRRTGKFVRHLFMGAFIFSIVLLPFFYHLLNLLLIPLLVPTIFIFAFIFFTGLTDFDRRKMIMISIIFSFVVFALYEGYAFNLIELTSHTDIHLNVTVWLIQVLAANLIFIAYQGIKALRVKKKLKEMG